jgi:hypothetical protein
MTTKFKWINGQTSTTVDKPMVITTIWIFWLSSDHLDLTPRWHRTLTFSTVNTLIVHSLRIAGLTQGPFTGVLVAPAAFSFIYRYMGNKSEEYPEGYLNGDVLMSFFSITKNSDGTFTHTPGHERIPDNWYKRAIGDEYGIPFLNTDTVLAGLKHPKFLSVGGNTGKVNTFTGLQPEDLTGGIFNAPSLLEGNNLACFAMQFAVQAAPDLIQGSNVISDLTGAMSNLTSALGSSLSGLSCPQLTKIDQSQFGQFPGYAKLKANGQY